MIGLIFVTVCNSIAWFAFGAGARKWLINGQKSGLPVFQWIVLALVTIGATIAMIVDRVPS